MQHFTETCDGMEGTRGAGLDAPYLGYLLLGLGTLLPWNALITAAGELAFDLALCTCMRNPRLQSARHTMWLGEKLFGSSTLAAADYWEAR